MTTEAWPFPDRFKEFMMPATQVREAIKRLQKRGAEIAADNEENLNVVKAVHQAYARKKERARTASTKARAAKSAEAEPLDIEVEPTEEAACVVCEVVAEAEQAPEPEAAPEPAAAAPPKAASKAAKSRADNVAPEAVPKKPVEAPPAPAPAPKRAAAAEAPARRRGGLVGMVASIALP